MDNLAALIHATAQAHPQRPALWVDGQQISYRELLAAASGIAAAIPHSPRRTAVLATRRMWSYIGIVGTVVAGHAYVPLNPRHPSDRVLSVLDRAEVGALIIESDALEDHRAVLGALYPCVIVVPDAQRLPDWTAGLPHRFVTASDLCAESRTYSIDPQDGAYLLFTSGSTGTPKGVMVKHANVMAYLRAVRARYDLTVADRTTQLFDLTFDLSVHDLWLTWAAGATLYCPSETARRAPGQFIQRHAVTCWFSTPSTVAFMQRLRILRPGAFPSLRLSLFCGEPLPTRLVREWMQAAPNALVENLYGPTEATIAITAFRVNPHLELPEIVPIGQPLSDHRAMIFDDGAVAPGTAGELYLSGPQVTDGYWQQPALTGERFVEYDHQRWYRTGDRAVLAADGLHFLGRLDRQVKISGYRVELAEIESVLREAAACASVAALAWPIDANGLAHGIAAVVADEARSEMAMIAACRRILPAYMLPSRWLRVPQWPLNSNGKTDYHELQRILNEGVKPDGG